MLTTITSIDTNVHLLSHLSYIDLKHFCKSHQQFKNVCQNDNLKKILYNTIPNFYLPSHIDISTALDDLYDDMLGVIYQNYTEPWPIWVNKN